MFDGEGVFLCSADEANPVVVDGARVPRDWTPVAVPSTLVFGRTRASLRGVVEVAPSRLPSVLPPPNPPPMRPASAPPPGGVVPPRPAISFDGPADPEAATLGAFASPDGGIEGVTPFEGIPQTSVIIHAHAPRVPPRPHLPSHSDEESTKVEPDRRSQPLVGFPSTDEEPTNVGPDVRLAASAPVLAPRPAAGAAAPKPPLEPFPDDVPTGSPPVDKAQRAALDALPRPAPAPPAGPSDSPFTRLALAVERGGEWLRVGLLPGSPRRKPIVFVGCSAVAVLVVTTITVVRLHAASTQAPALPPQPPPALAQAAPSASAAVPASPGVSVIPAPPRPPPEPSADPAPRGKRGKPPEPLPPTTERAAADAMNRGDLPAALALYRQLAQEQPDNPAFANAVRILQPRPAPPAAAP
jgi:hypothetical protein